MGVQYLVDYENVHESGLCGMDALAAEDGVFIFHTSTGDRISLSRLDDVQAWVKVILVPPGKQSLDMHLASFLGYLIGKDDVETTYAIVSHDSDYRRIADFWNRAYGRNDKVRCVHGIKYSDGVTDPDVWASVPADYSPRRSVIREFILRMFSKHAEVRLSNAPCMLVSQLCSLLNTLPEYLQERERLGKKPMQYLVDECGDFLCVRKQWMQEWAYLIPMEGNGITQTDIARADGIPENAMSEEEPDIDEEMPDIMEIGDLSIDEEPDAQEEVHEESVPDPVLSATLDFIRKGEGVVRDEEGRIRASALRDELMKLPGFRESLRESGMKPIPFMQKQFAGSVEICRLKGIWWAAEHAVSFAAEDGDTERDAVLAERRKEFRETAFRNMQQRLSDAGLDQNAAEEIAAVCLRSDSVGEQRKTIHQLLCSRFGSKTGAKYYRQAVKYIGA